jgi:hypothetical protein
MARRMAVEKLREEHFRVINGLGPKDRLTPGRRVKIIIQGTVRRKGS